jgi:hypothetical protein
MGINPAALALFDHLGALRHEIERRQSQPQAETRQCLGRTNQGRFQLKTIRFIVSKVLLDIKPQSASIMASATPFWRCATPKHLAAKSEMNSKL